MRHHMTQDNYIDIYTTIQDYADEVVTPALELSDEISPTHEQKQEIARAMTVWHDEYTPAGDINMNKSGFIENDTVDFWEVVAAVIGD